MKNYSILFLFVFILSACIETEEPPYPLPQNAVNMLSGDESKTWKLVKRFSNKTQIELDNCYKSYKQTFFSNRIMRDNKDSMQYCGETLTAEWKFSKDNRDYYYIQLTSEQIPRLMGIQENEKLFKIRYIDSNELVVEHPDNQFSSGLATITDIYVPEGSSINTFRYEQMISALD